MKRSKAQKFLDSIPPKYSLANAIARVAQQDGKPAIEIKPDNPDAASVFVLCPLDFEAWIHDAFAEIEETGDES